MSDSGTQRETGPAIVMTPPARGQEVVSITATPALPTLPSLVELEGDLADEVLFRRFMARQAASQTLAAQRTEWYARSVRLYVLWWFWLSVVGAFIGFIWFLVAADAEPSYSPYFP
jgi:hypothetical protein